jgi:hypothetical protein
MSRSRKSTRRTRRGDVRRKGVKSLSLTITNSFFKKGYVMKIADGTKSRIDSAAKPPILKIVKKCSETTALKSPITHFYFQRGCFDGLFGNGFSTK